MPRFVRLSDRIVPESKVKFLNEKETIAGYFRKDENGRELWTVEPVKVAYTVEELADACYIVDNLNKDFYHLSAFYWLRELIEKAIGVRNFVYDNPKDAKLQAEYVRNIKNFKPKDLKFKFVAVIYIELPSGVIVMKPIAESDIFGRLKLYE